MFHAGFRECFGYTSCALGLGPMLSTAVARSCFTGCGSRFVSTATSQTDESARLHPDATGRPNACK